MTRIRASFDPQADMHAIIDRADEADDFAEAWLGAIRGLAQALGLDDCKGFYVHGQHAKKEAAV
jgi:hypothetical protein